MESGMNNGTIADFGYMNGGGDTITLKNGVDNDSKETVDNMHLYRDKFFLLKIYLDGVPNDIADKYREVVDSRQAVVEKYIRRYYIDNSRLVGSVDELPEHLHVDCGFDLFVCDSQLIGANNTGFKVDSHVKTAMYYDSIPCGFYLYPRSSTGSKTPLRLANSVGIIDSGYRGNCISVFDNNTHRDYEIRRGDRLVQVCGGNLLYPIYPVIVDSVDELGNTYRGANGFGSSGR